jgi:hypothetical protein
MVMGLMLDTIDTESTKSVGEVEVKWRSKPVKMEKWICQITSRAIINWAISILNFDSQNGNQD